MYLKRLLLTLTNNLLMIDPNIIIFIFTALTKFSEFKDCLHFRIKRSPIKLKIKNSILFIKLTLVYIFIYQMAILQINLFKNLYII